MARVKVISREITTLHFVVTVKEMNESGTKVYNEYTHQCYDIGQNEKALKAEIEKAFKSKGVVVDIEPKGKTSDIYEWDINEIMPFARLSKRQIADKESDTDTDTDTDNG